MWLAVFLTTVLLGSGERSYSREGNPLQITFDDVPGISQASTAIGLGWDSTLGNVEIIRAAWMNGDSIYYRSGPLGNLSRPYRVTRGPQRGADPALIVSRTGKLRFFWAEERSPDPNDPRKIVVVPGEWNLLTAFDPYVDPVWFNEDLGTPRVVPDRHPALAGQNDTNLVVWERGTPSRIHYAFLVPQVSPQDARKIAIEGYPLPGVRPWCAGNPSGEFWAVWTAIDGFDGDIWAAKITMGGYHAPIPVRLGPTDDRSPAIAVDATGRPHIVWQVGRDGGPILYTYGFLGGGLSSIITLTPPGAVAQNPQILIGGDGALRVLWQNADGALDATMILGTKALAPVTLIPGRYNPRQRIEGVAEVWPGIFISQSGGIITAFIAPDPLTQVRNLWLTYGTEESAGAAIERLVAEPSGLNGGAVVLRWDSRSLEGLVRFEVRRRKAGEDERRAARVASVSVDDRCGEGYCALDQVGQAGRYVYRVDAVDGTGAPVGSASLAVDLERAVSGARLRATPNPFNGTTSLLIDLDVTTDVRAEVYAITGHRVRTLVHGGVLPGEHRFLWDGCDDVGRPLGSGRYYVRCRLEHAGGHVLDRTIPLTLLR